MNPPFFSIVIPTKNRPELLRDAMSSVLLQNFRDFELIVSDNYNDERTKGVVDEFINDNRILYIRTPSELSMPEHWEFATLRATGTYVLILSDRSFFRQGALQYIHAFLISSEQNISVCFWKRGRYDEKNKIVWGEKEERGIHFLDSVSIIDTFVHTLNVSVLPRPHHGCYKSDIANNIRKTYGSLFLPAGPDNTSAFSFLALCKKISFIPSTLFFMQGEVVSNGTEVLYRDPWSFLNSLRVTNLYAYVPIKEPFVYSLIFNDFLMVRECCGGNLLKIDVRWEQYFFRCLEELWDKKIMGMEKSLLQQYRKEFNRALLTTDSYVQKKFKKEKHRLIKRIMRSYIRETPIGSFLAKLKRKASGRTITHAATALDAGGFTT